MSSWRILAVITLIVVTSCARAQAEARFALVIGNGDYRALSPLKNPAKDASLMARVLGGSLGYKVVGGEDLDRASMVERIKNFTELVRGAGTNTVAMIFFAGHGMEVGDENYLFPVDAVGPVTRENASTTAISLTHIMKELDRSGSRIKVVILDACRDDKTRSANRGFRSIGTPLGSIVVYSTAPGATAHDGDGENSPFTAALAELIKTPAVSAEEVLFRVQDQVHRSTRPAQTPWVKPNLNGVSFSFNPVAGEPTAPRPVAAIRPNRHCDTPRGPYAVKDVDEWDHLNVRGAPEVPKDDGTSTSNVTFKLPPNATGIELVGEACTAGWCRIRYKCVEGWAAERYITLSTGNSTPVAGFRMLGEFGVRVPAHLEPLYVRESPHHLAPVVTELRSEQGVSTHYCVNPKKSKETWCYVSRQDRNGWANARYLLDVRTGLAPLATR